MWQQINASEKVTGTTPDVHGRLVHVDFSSRSCVILLKLNWTPALISPSLPGYSGSEDCVAMETLLQGFDEQDEDQVYRVCNSPLLKYMDNDVSFDDTFFLNKHEDIVFFCSIGRLITILQGLYIFYSSILIMIHPFSQSAFDFQMRNVHK